MSKLKAYLMDIFRTVSCWCKLSAGRGETDWKCSRQAAVLTVLSSNCSKAPVMWLLSHWLCYITFCHLLPCLKANSAIILSG